MTANYKRILVPIDGSEAAIGAYKVAVDLAQKFDATIHLVTVEASNAFTDTRDLRDAKSEQFEKFEAYAAERGLTVRGETKYGDPVHVIGVELVDEYGIDLIVMGATGKSGLVKMVVGSVASGVTDKAKCSVLIVRP